MSGSTNLSALLGLPAATIREIASALRSGSLKHGVTPGLLAPFVGSSASETCAALVSLSERGCPVSALADVCAALYDAKLQVERLNDDFFLTLSGPDVPGIPVVDTATVVRSLFNEAKHEVLLATYVFHDVRDLLSPLAARLDAEAEFKVRIVVDLTHQRRQTDEPLPIVANRFKKTFLNDQWAGTRKPGFWHDPRVFTESDRRTAGVMHAKVVVIDDTAALVTSANFTEAAQSRNIEAGVIFRQTNQVRRLRDYFDGLIQQGLLVPVT